MSPAPDSTGSHSVVQLAPMPPIREGVTLPPWAITMIVGALISGLGGMALILVRVGGAVERLEGVVSRVGAMEGRIATAAALELRVVALEQQITLHRTLGERIETRVNRNMERLDELSSKVHR